MKIENLLLNKFIIDNRDEIFKEGYTFKGKVLELIDNLILIDIKGHGTIQGKLEPNVKMSVNDEISFLVKSVDNDEIILKPLIKDKFPELQLSKDCKENNPISNLLKNINVKESKLSIGLAENLMKYNAPLTEQNLTDGIKTLEKLFQLISLTDDEKVILINTPNLEKDSISGKIEVDRIENNEENLATKVDTNTKELSSVEDDFLDNLMTPEKVDIKSLLVIHEDDFKRDNDITQFVKDFLGSEINLEREDDYIKIISFFLKNNIKPSLNNIKTLREFNDDPIEFIKELILIDKILSKSDNHDSNKILSEVNENLNTKNIISNRDEKFIELQKSIRNLDNITGLKSKEDIRNLENRIDFLRDMNKDLYFLFYPINNKQKELDGVLTLIKENKKKKGYNERTNIYINVETHYLGNIKVSCQLVSNSLTIKMNIKKEDLELFKSTEKHLVEKISFIGYSLDKIEFVIDNNIQIIDSMVSNANPTYILDLKV